jgi:hypothetical protein
VYNSLRRGRMKDLQLTSLNLLVVLTLLTPSFAETCPYGLGYYSSSREACLALQKKALRRVASAKTICYSGNSQVQWSKNNKQPMGAFTTMRTGARIAMKGFTPLYACERADLVIRIDYNDISETVTLAVTDAESGDPVFREERSVSDLGSDVSRMASHFQAMLSDARAAAKADLEGAQAKAKEEAFLAGLPRHWHHVVTCAARAVAPCPQGPAVDVWIEGDLLYETASSTSTVNGGQSLKREVNCTVKRGADETTPWAGDCTYKLFWNNEGTPTCTVKTNETITSVTADWISGRSQRVDYAPLHQTPPTCPIPSSENQDFTLTHDKAKE